MSLAINAAEERACQRLQQFARWIERLAEQARRGEAMAAVRDCLEQSAEHWLREQANEPKAAERRIKNLLELIEWPERMPQDSWPSESIG